MKASVLAEAAVDKLSEHTQTSEAVARDKSSACPSMR